MSVNGITTNGYDSAAYTKVSNNSTANDSRKTDNTNSSASAAFTKDAAVYEASDKTTAKQKSNAAIVAKMKQDLADRTSKMQNLVADMFAKQGQTFASSSDMIKALANGYLQVDELPLRG